MTPQERKVFVLALEALEREARGYAVHDKLQIPRSMRDAIVAINEALAQPEKPDYKTLAIQLQEEKRLAQHKPLSENEIKHLWYEACQTNLELTSQLIVHLAKAIEAAHGIKE